MLKADAQTRPPMAVSGLKVGAWLGIAMGLVYGLLVGVNGELRWFERLGSGLAFGVGYGFPALLALMALNGRRSLLVPASVLSILLSVTSVAGATLPLIVPGVIYLVAFKRSLLSRFRAASTAAVSVLFIAAVGWLLVGPATPACWVTTVRDDGSVDHGRVPADASGLNPASERHNVSGNVVATSCTSDAISWKKSLPALALFGTSLGVGFASRKDNERDSTHER